MYQTQESIRRKPIRDRLLSLELSDLLGLAGINLLLFQVALQPMIPIGSYLDEAACIILALIAVLRKSIVLSRQLRLALVFLLCFIAASALSSLFSGVNPGLTAFLIDVFTCAKFAIALWASYRLLSHSEALLALLQAEAKLLLSLLFVLAIINLFTDIGVGATGDFGISRAFRFIYYHPSAVVWLSVALVSTLLFDVKANRLYIGFGMVVACSTLTSKGIGWAVAIAVVIVLMNQKGRISAASLILSVVAIIASAWGSIVLYYSNATVTTARSALLNTSLDIAEEFFPFGSGFATFGSAVTADPAVYSPLYYQYGLNTIWGLTPMDPSYLSDTFWPIVIAQSGLIGTCCFIGFLACLVWSCFRFDTRPLESWFPSLCIIGYLLLGSVAESSFFNPSSVYLAILLGLYIGRSSQKEGMA